MNVENTNRNYPPYEELIKQIPMILKVVKKCSKKERELISHTPEFIAEEREKFTPFFEIIQGKWTFDVIHLLNVQGEIHYSEIKNILKGISSRVLADKLKFLEEKGIIERIVHDTRPVRISYKLTITGENIINLLIPAMIYYEVHDYLNKKLEKSG